MITYDKKITDNDELRLRLLALAPSTGETDVLSLLIDVGGASMSVRMKLDVALRLMWSLGECLEQVMPEPPPMSAEDTNKLLGELEEIYERKERGE